MAVSYCPYGDTGIRKHPFLFVIYHCHACGSTLCLFLTALIEFRYRLRPHDISACCHMSTHMLWIYSMFMSNRPY